MLHYASEVDKEGQFIIVLAIEFVFERLYFSKYSIGFGYDFTLGVYLHDLILFDLVIHQLLNNFFILINDLSDSHVDLHLLEDRTLITNFLDNLQLLYHLLMLVVTNRDIFDIDQHLIHRDVVVTAQLKFYLHGFDQDVVHTFMGRVELLLFVVDTVEQILKMRYF